MLDLKEIARNFDAVVARLKDRGGALDLSQFQTLFAERKALHVEVETLQAKRNGANEEMKKDPKSPAALEARAALRVLGDDIKQKEVRLKEVEGTLEQLLYGVPNVPHASVPTGSSEADNQVTKTWGEKPSFLFPAKQHFEVGERLGLLDFERATKVSGPRFAFLRGHLAKLERALVSFM